MEQPDVSRLHEDYSTTCRTRSIRSGAFFIGGYTTDKNFLPQVWVRQGNSLIFSGERATAAWGEWQPGSALQLVARFELVGCTEKILSIYITKKVIRDYSPEAYIGLITETIRREVRDRFEGGFLNRPASERGADVRSTASEQGG